MCPSAAAGLTVRFNFLMNGVGPFVCPLIVNTAACALDRKEIASSAIARERREVVFIIGNQLMICKVDWTRVPRLTAFCTMAHTDRAKRARQEQTGCAGLGHRLRD